MNYVPGLGKPLFIVGIMGSAAGILILLRQADEDLMKCCEERLWRNWLCYGVGISLTLSVGAAYFLGLKGIALLFLGVYLLVCTVTDVLLCQVYDVMQYVGILGGIIWLLVQKPGASIGFSIIFFALIQYVDGMGYCICSLYLAGAGVDIEGYLYHMFICFCLLAVVQGVKGNISRKGNLKKTVALYPYISVGFLMMWIFLS